MPSFMPLTEIILLSSIVSDTGISLPVIVIVSSLTLKLFSSCEMIKLPLSKLSTPVAMPSFMSKAKELSSWIS